MLENIKYVNSQGNVLEFGKKYIFANENDLRNYQWIYDSDRKCVENFQKKITEKTLPVTICCPTQRICRNVKNDMFELFEQDIINEVPGKLYIGDYYLECFIYASDKSDYLIGQHTKLSLKIVTAADAWVKEELFQYRYETIESDDSGRGYSYGYEYDYSASPGNATQFANSNFNEAEFIMTIYGYAQNPAISIGGHIYALNYTIQAGERVEIDSKRQTIRLYKLNGATVNIFRFRDRKNDIFHKIKSGEQAIYWNADFNFDLLLKAERSEPIWM